MDRSLDAEYDGTIFVGDEHDTTSECLQGVGTVGVVLEFDETISTRAASLDIDHDRGGDQRAEGTEPLVEEIVVDTHGEICDVEVGEGLKRLGLLLLLGQGATGNVGVAVAVGVEVGRTWGDTFGKVEILLLLSKISRLSACVATSKSSCCSTTTSIRTCKVAVVIIIFIAACTTSSSSNRLLMLMLRLLLMMRLFMIISHN